MVKKKIGKPYDEIIKELDKEIGAKKKEVKAPLDFSKFDRRKELGLTALDVSNIKSALEGRMKLWKKYKNERLVKDYKNTLKKVEKML